MRVWIRVLRAEALKIKRSLAFWLAVVMPLTVIFLQVVLIWDRGISAAGQALGSSWLWLGRQTMVFWALLMLPLFVTLETALAAGLEHQADAWKHLFSLPVPRRAVYAAKLAAGLGLIALSQIVLVLGIVLAGALLAIGKPGLGFQAPVPWLSLLVYAGVTYAAAWLLVGLHTWVAVRWRSFVVATGFGIAMTVAGVIVINSRWAAYYPWTLPAVAMNALKPGGPIPSQLPLSLLGFLIAALVGGWEFLRRDVF
jgi:hypothetical protein